MRNNWILFPVIVQIMLIVEAYLMLAWTRARVGNTGTVDLKRAKVDSEAWPEPIRLINNNIRNQFEVPVLFFVLVIILWQMNAAGPWAQAFAWLFVVSRIVHAYVHTGKNRVMLRFGTFMFGLAMIVAMSVLVLIEAFGGMRVTDADAAAASTPAATSTVVPSTAPAASVPSK